MLRVPRWVAVLFGVAFATLAVMFWSVKRRRAPRLALENEAGINDLIPSIAGLTQGTVTEGNRIELLQNGAFWDRLFHDLEQARVTINFETFLTRRGVLTRRMADVLSRKAREGVRVRMMLDGTGGRHFGRRDLHRLREAGAQVRKYHPLRLSNLGILNNRDHRKIVVIDGRIGYVGGHCLTDNWLGEAEDKQHFRDVSARCEGPVVRQLQSAFAENWIEETGEVMGGDEYFPNLEPAGDVKAHAVWVSPAGSPSSVKLLHYIAIHAAKKKIRIQNPYFLPDPAARDALIEAARRGVDVAIMIPAATASDAPLVQHASHHHYGTLLRGGVKLFDYERTLLHQKVMVIDDRWATVGSTNFDDRSFELNDEVALAIYDEPLARALAATFDRDTAHARRIELADWRRRPLSHKLMNFLAYLLNEQL